MSLLSFSFFPSTEMSCMKVFFFISWKLLNLVTTDMLSGMWRKIYKDGENGKRKSQVEQRYEVSCGFHWKTHVWQQQEKQVTMSFLLHQTLTANQSSVFSWQVSVSQMKLKFRFPLLVYNQDHQNKEPRNQLKRYACFSLFSSCYILFVSTISVHTWLLD